MTHGITRSTEHQRLTARKDEILATLLTLREDFEAKDLDTDTYEHAVNRLEHEAAAILQRIDELGETVDDQMPVRRGSGQALFVTGGTALVIAGLVVILLVSLRPRQQGSSANPAPTPVPSVIAGALRAVALHPGQVTPLLRLGNAYLDSGDADFADRAYVQAMKVAPNDPEPATLHAMMLGSSRQYAGAETLLAGVEASHPRFARAWLLDGLIASRTRGGAHRAVHAWTMFLRLQPHAAVAPRVRRWLRSVHADA